MGYHKDRSVHAFLYFPEALDHGAAGLGIQIAGRFVRKDDQGIVDQAARHSRPLFLTAGNLGRVFGRDMLDAEKSRQPVGELLRLSGHFALYDPRHQNIFTDGQPV